MLCALPRLGLTPVASGCWPPPNEKLVFWAVVNTKGMPEASVRIPLLCHPPRKRLGSPCQPEPNRLPAPKGSSEVKLKTRRCGYIISAQRVLAAQAIPTADGSPG